MNMDRALQIIVSGDPISCQQALEDFQKTAGNKTTFPELGEDNKRRAVWESLFKLIDSTDDKLLQENIFRVVRILSRDKVDLHDIISDDWIKALMKYSGLDSGNTFSETGSYSVAIETLKCMSNIIYNCQLAAVRCCRSGVLEGLTNRIKKYKSGNIPRDIKLFDLKLLFLLSAKCPEYRGHIKNELQVDKYLTDILEQLVNETITEESGYMHLPCGLFSDQSVELASEILKILFNTTIRSTAKDEEELANCSKLVNIIRNLLLVKTSDLQNVAIKENAMHLMINMPDETYENLVVPFRNIGNEVVDDKTRMECNTLVLKETLKVLEIKFKDEIAVSQQNNVLLPIITFLLRCAKNVRIFRKYMREIILPPLTNVKTRPEEGDTLRNHLCRLLTSPMVQVRDVAAELLFIICKKSVARMIKYTGYGNAAGLFASRGLLGGKRDEEGEAEFSSESEDSETEEFKQHKHGINPVIGCYEEPHPSPMANMSEEQKEHEAMKLVELIDSMTKCGTIKPCTIGEDGRPQPIEHVLQLRENMPNITNDNSDSD